jgi:hypothetical protein
MGALNEILATIRRLPLPERLQLIERATLEVVKAGSMMLAIGT